MQKYSIDFCINENLNIIYIFNVIDDDENWQSWWWFVDGICDVVAIIKIINHSCDDYKIVDANQHEFLYLRQILK